MENINKDMGNFIRELRQAVGMSQQMLAKQVGVSYQQLQKYEKGRSKLSVSRLREISIIFGVPIEDFFDNNSGVQKAARFSNFTDDEGTMLMLYRKISGKRRRVALLDMLTDMLILSRGFPRPRAGRTC